ncbi:MAG: outer membrane protein assembly factor BamB [Pseudomonadales bacterium]|nr:outer membrane protein assembly factor BamB [Pseudomonadales bacterium]
MKAMLRLTIALLLVSSVTACGFLGGIIADDDEGPKPAPLVNFDAELKIKTVWSTGVGDGVGEKYIKLVPAVDEGKVFIADVNGQVMALNRETGKSIWRVKLREPVSGGVGVGFGYLFLGTKDGKVIALNQTDGSRAWQANLSSEILSVPKTNGNIVVVQTLDEKIYGLDQASGEQRWFYESILPALTLRGSSSPIVSGNVVVVGLANGKVVALDSASGRAAWEKRLSVPRGRSELERMTDVDGDLLLQGDMVYATSFQGKTSAIELNTARVRWQKEISSFLGPDEGFGNLYVVDTDDEIYALDQKTGDNVWKQSDLNHRQITAPTTFGNYLVVGDFEGYVHFMSQVDGHFVARKKIDGDGIRSTMVARKDMLYIYGNSGKIVALKVNLK